MIFDDFKNIKLYNIDPEIIDFILNIDSKIKVGKHIISDKAYINIDEYKTKDNPKLEAHKKYIDIQFVLKGKEKVYTTSKENLEILEKYNEEKDVIFYKTPNYPLNVSYLSENKFIILYPDDVHGPCVNFENDVSDVKKAVVKIKI